MSHSYSIVVLISGNGSNLEAILKHIDSGEINAEISAVISNRADAYGLKRANKRNIPTKVIDHKEFENRNAFDGELSKVIENYHPDLIILAGFMRILGDNFVNHFQGKLINIHPSLLPAYKGLHTHRRALADYKKKLIAQHGASVHYVIPELDAGTVILQGSVPILEGDTEDSLSDRVHKIEHIIYPKAVKWLANGDLKFISGKVLFHKKELAEPKIIYSE